MTDEQRWAAMIWLAHTHARGGDFNKANALLDLVQVQARAKSDSVEEDVEAMAALHAAMDLRRSLHVMARS